MYNFELGDKRWWYYQFSLPNPLHLSSKGWENVLSELGSERVKSPYPRIRTDKSGQTDHPGVGEQLGHLADSPDVLLPVFWWKPQIPVQSRAHVVPVQRVGRDPLSAQVILQRHTQGRLARTGETCGPKTEQRGLRKLILIKRHILMSWTNPLQVRDGRPIDGREG